MANSTTTMRGRSRDALMTAARESLTEHGFAGSSARSICALAGTNLRSVGYHYGSVRALLLAALSQNFREWMAPLVATLAESSPPDVSPVERLERGLSLLVDELPDRMPLVAAWLEAVALSWRDAELREQLAVNRATFRDALAGTLREAGAHDPTAFADALMVVCDGVFTRRLLHGSAPDPREIAATLARDLRLVR